MKLHTRILISLLAAVALGGGLHLAGWHDWMDGAIRPALDLVAKIFLRLLSMIVVPVVVCSLITGIVGEGKLGSLGKIGARTVGLYLISTFLAIMTGFILVNLFDPGIGSDLTLPETSKDNIGAPGNWTELLIRVAPSNVVQAMASGDMLAVIFFTVFFAVFCLRVKDESRIQIVSFFQSLLDVVMAMTMFIIGLAPYGVFCLIVSLILDTGFSAFLPLAKYFVTVLVALAIHFFIVLPLLVRLFTSLSPWKLMTAMSPALLTAFSTASSSATLPLTMACAEKRAGIKNRINSFVLPLGATVNMDGTALYECVAVIFIAQVLGYDLSATKQAAIILTSLLVSIGAAGIPHAGLVMMVIIFQAVGLPLEATGMIWAVDRFLDMGRTMTNVWSDCVCNAIVASSESEIDMVIFNADPVEVVHDRHPM